jgi:hypothetical protein
MALRGFRLKSENFSEPEAMPLNPNPVPAKAGFEICTPHINRIPGRITPDKEKA